MFKHKIFELLKSFSPEQIGRLGDLIDSRYFNRSKNVATAYRFIKQFYPDFDNDKLSRTTLYFELFKSKKYKDSSIRNVFSSLQNLALMFIAVEKMSKDVMQRNNLILEDLLRRNQEELFIRVAKESDNFAAKVQEVDFDYLLNRYKLERNKFNYSFFMDKIIHKKKIYPQIKSISNSGIYLSIYYITEMVSELVNISSYAERFNAEEELQATISIILQSVDTTRILSAVKGRNDCDFMLEIYLSLREAFENLDKDVFYNRYKELILKNSKRMSRDEISFHYTILVSCCIVKGKLYSYPEKNSIEQLSLYEEILTKRYYKNKKALYLSDTMYRDMLLFFARMNRLDLVKNLISEYSSKLQPKNQENMRNFSYAYYYYKLKDYGRSLEYINRIKLDYFIYKYDVKSLQLRVYYEYGYFEEGLSLIHSYRELLRKDDFLLDPRKIRLRNFINHTRKLIMYRLNDDTDDLETLRTDLETDGNTSFRSWLIEKILQEEKRKK